MPQQVTRTEVADMMISSPQSISAAAVQLELCFLQTVVVAK
jgi:hypothetical protein